MKHSKQMSESVRLGILLALSGGLMDAYSYIVRDRVFANAQTGNMLFCNQQTNLFCHQRTKIIAVDRRVY